LLGIFIAEELKDEENRPQSIYYAGDKNQYPAELSDIEQHIIEDANHTNHDDIIDVLELNLLNGFSRGDNALFNINWKPWLPALTLVGILGILWLGMLSWKNHLLSNKLQQLELQIESVYKRTFPNSKIQNASVQMRQKLKELQKNKGSTGGSSLQTIATVAPFLKKFPKISLKEIRYQNNELLLVISAPNVTRLEAFKNTLIKDGALNVEIKSSTTTANKVESTLVIKGIV
jgi:type II secretory pathway component PulL